jgi:GTP-binding protein
LRPYIGEVKFVDDTKIVLSDLPGIIEGAHENKGLGHDFLQHAERTKVLLYVLDGSVAEDERTPLKDYRVLYRELQLYKGGILLQKPSLIALNKSDRKYTNFEAREATLRRAVHAPLVSISAKEGDGLELLLEQLREMVFPDEKVI